MSNALQLDVAQKPIDESLSELEDKCKEGSPGSNQDVAIGPFGVFRLQSQPSEPSKHPTPQSAPDSTCLPSSVADPTQSTAFIDSLNMDDFLDWPDLFDLEIPQADFVPQSFDEDFADITSLHGVGSRSRETPFRNSSEEHVACPEDVTDITRPSSPRTMGLSLRSDLTIRDLSCSDAQILLKHFKDHVISHMWALPVIKKSPWETLNLNSAVSTLARLTYMTTQSVSHAALSNLLALSSIAAQHLAAQLSKHSEATTDVGHWQHIATLTSKEAKRHLQWSLRNEVRGPNKAKYKEQLMAIIAMLALAVRHRPTFCMNVLTVTRFRYSLTGSRTLEHI